MVSTLCYFYFLFLTEPEVAGLLYRLVLSVMLIIPSVLIMPVPVLLRLSLLVFLLPLVSSSLLALRPSSDQAHSNLFSCLFPC